MNIRVESFDLFVSCFYWQLSESYLKQLLSIRQEIKELKWDKVSVRSTRRSPVYCALLIVFMPVVKIPINC